MSVGIAYGSYSLGVSVTRLDYEKELLSLRTKQDRLLIDLESAQKDIEDARSRGVKTIYVEKDPTGCADTVVPDGVLAVFGKAGDKPSSNF